MARKRRVPKQQASEGRSVYFSLHRRTNTAADLHCLPARIVASLAAIKAIHSSTEPAEQGGWIDTYRVSVPVGVGQRWTAWLETAVSGYALPHGQTFDRADPFHGCTYLAAGRGSECRATGNGEDTRAAKARAALKARQVQAGLFARPPMPERLMFSLFGEGWRWADVPDCKRYEDGLSVIHDGWEGTKAEWRSLEERWSGFAPVFYRIRDSLTLAMVGVEGIEPVEFGRWGILHRWVQTELSRPKQGPRHSPDTADTGSVPDRRLYSESAATDELGRVATVPNQEVSLADRLVSKSEAWELRNQDSYAGE